MFLFKSLNNKKGELTLQVIVIAVLLLLVLVVLTFIFSNRMGLFNTGIRHCDTLCVEETAQCEENNYELPILWNSCEDSKGHKFKGTAYCCKQKSTP